MEPAFFCFAKYRKQLTWLQSSLIALFHWKCFLWGRILIKGGSPGQAKLPFNKWLISAVCCVSIKQQHRHQPISDRKGWDLVWPLTLTGSQSLSWLFGLTRCAQWEWTMKRPYIRRHCDISGGWLWNTSQLTLTSDRTGSGLLLYCCSRVCAIKEPTLCPQLSYYRKQACVCGLLWINSFVSLINQSIWWETI